MQSGIRYLALVIPQIVALIFSGAVASATGHYVSVTDFALLGSY
jgi:hypothetical protein